MQLKQEEIEMSIISTINGDRSLRAKNMFYSCKP